MKTISVLLLSLALLSTASCKRLQTSDSDVEMSGGTLATGQEFFIPKIVSLIMPIEEGKAAFCTGVILGPRHVLTAGHCVDTAKEVIVERYEKDLSTTSRKAVAWKHFPKLKVVNGGVSNMMAAIDLGVVLLDKPYPGPFVTLNPALGQSIADAVYVGMGTSEGGRFDRKLRYAKNIKSSKVQYRGWGSVWNSRGSAKLCQGDSGGPLLTPKGELIGVQSSSSYLPPNKKCGESLESHHADVYSHMDWVVCTYRKWGVPLPGFEKMVCE